MLRLVPEAREERGVRDRGEEEEGGREQGVRDGKRVRGGRARREREDSLSRKIGERGSFCCDEETKGERGKGRNLGLAVAVGLGEAVGLSRGFANFGPTPLVAGNKPLQVFVSDAMPPVYFYSLFRFLPSVLFHLRHSPCALFFSS